MKELEHAATLLRLSERIRREIAFRAIAHTPDTSVLAVVQVATRLTESAGAASLAEYLATVETDAYRQQQYYVDVLRRNIEGEVTRERVVRDPANERGITVGAAQRLLQSIAASRGQSYLDFLDQTNDYATQGNLDFSELLVRSMEERVHSDAMQYVATAQHRTVESIEEMLRTYSRADQGETQYDTLTTLEEVARSERMTLREALTRFVERIQLEEVRRQEEVTSQALVDAA